MILLVLGCSDDMNVRVWKAEASQQLGTLLPREKHKQAYDKALLERYKHMDEVNARDLAYQRPLSSPYKL